MIKHQTIVLDRHETRNLFLPYKYAHANFVNGEESANFSGDPNRISSLIIPAYDYRYGSQAREPQNKGMEWAPTPDKFIEFSRWFWDNCRNEEVEGFVVNCGVGASRSAGLALTINRALGLTEAYLFENRYTPNPLVYASACVALLTTEGIPCDNNLTRKLLAFPPTWRE